jgi:toxin FitB
MFLLDTNVISEQTKPQPDPGVTDWLERHGVGESYLSVITLGEIEQGILLLGNSKRARAYRAWLEKLEHEFDGRILGVDRAVERTWAKITARAIQTGKTLAYADSLIAAIGVTHNLSIVTRNTDDFVSVTKNLVNPWRDD